MKYRSRCSPGDCYSSPWSTPALWDQGELQGLFLPGEEPGPSAVASLFSSPWVFWSGVSGPQNNVPWVFLKRWAVQQLLWLVCTSVGNQRAVTQQDIEPADGKCCFKQLWFNLIYFLFFLSVLAGQKILHHRSDVLETVVLINPSDEAVSTEVSQKILDLS